MGAVKPMVRLPSTNSRIWSNVSRSMFCMMMFIHPQHDTFLRLSRSGSPRIGNNLPLRARPALETNHPFRLIPHWIILGLEKRCYIVYSPLMLKLKVGFGFLPSILLITAGLGFSHTGTGKIHGVVKDATGAVVPSATVTIAHTATGGQNKTQTNVSRLLLFPVDSGGRVSNLRRIGWDGCVEGRAEPAGRPIRRGGARAEIGNHGHRGHRRRGRHA